MALPGEENTYRDSLGRGILHKMEHTSGAGKSLGGVGRSGRGNSIRIRCQGQSGFNNLIDSFSDLALMLLPTWYF